MSLVRQILRIAAPLPKLESYTRFLFIGPHPDDIEIGAGATAAKLAAVGKQICFLVCLDGRYGLTNAPQGTSPEQLIAIRKQEAELSAARLGVNNLRFLGLSDGGFYSQQELLEGIAAVIGEFKPEVLFAPDPCVSSECHSDHLNVGEAVRRLACFAPYGEIMERLGDSSAPVSVLAYYMTAKPNTYVNTAGYLSRQLSAVFDCHLSQFPRGCAEAKSIPLYLRLRSAEFGLHTLSGSAEGFRVLGQTQMHCLPEAGAR